MSLRVFSSITESSACLWTSGLITERENYLLDNRVTPVKEFCWFYLVLRKASTKQSVITALGTEAVQNIPSSCSVKDLFKPIFSLVFNDFQHLPRWHEILCNCSSSQSKIYFILFLISLFLSKAANLFMSLSLRNHPHFNSAPRSCTVTLTHFLQKCDCRFLGDGFVSWAIAQSQSVWKALWGSLWLEMKIAFGNPTKRINFDFISGLFSKLIINLPAGLVPSTRLVGRGGMAHVKHEQRAMEWFGLGK